MTKTQHMQIRMQQRRITPGHVEATLLEGKTNKRGDRQFLGRDKIDELLLSTRYEMSFLSQRANKLNCYAMRPLQRRINELERLRRRGGATVVTDGSILITTYSSYRVRPNVQ